MGVMMFKNFLLWNFIINIGLLLWWFLFIVFAGNFVYKMHNKFIPVTREHFNSIHYAGIAVYKIANLVLFLVPYIVISIVI